MKKVFLLLFTFLIACAINAPPVFADCEKENSGFCTIDAQEEAPEQSISLSLSEYEIFKYNVMRQQEVFFIGQGIPETISCYAYTIIKELKTNTYNTIGSSNYIQNSTKHVTIRNVVGENSYAKIGYSMWS